MDTLTLRNAITIFANLLQLLVFIRWILSLIRLRSSGPAGPLIQLVYALTDPIILPIRALLEKSPLGRGMGSSGVMIDFSPMIAVLLISGVHRFLMTLL